MTFGSWHSWASSCFVIADLVNFFLSLVVFYFAPTLFIRNWDFLAFPDFLCQKTSNSCNTLRSHSVALVYSYNIFLDWR